MTPLETLIEQARMGNYEAFATIVNRFQGMAYATAYDVLRHHQTSQEVVQEAFIDAYCHLDQLQNLSAFPGWFRRIVMKYIDRVIRRQELFTQPVDIIPDLASATPGPEAQLEHLELAAAIRQALSSLPEKQQQAITLFYIYGYTQQEIAAFLDVPPGTVKKRLHDARQKLRNHHHIVRHHIAPQIEHLSERVAFFVALRRGDIELASDLLTAYPHLITARTHWNMDAGTPYWPHHFTALHWAAAAGDIAMTHMLLAQGGNVDAVTDSGMTPLHLAALMNHLALTLMLVEHGASASALTAAGLTPSDIAALRGHRTLHRLLAAPTDTISKGKHNMAKLNALSRMVADRHLSPDSVESILNGPRRLETGIKVIDLFAPLQAGGVNVIYTSLEGVGLLVVIGEIIYRMAVIEGGYTLCISAQTSPEAVDQLMKGWREMGVAHYLTQFTCQTPEQEAPAMKAALSMANRILAEGQSHILLLVDARLAADHHRDIQAAAGMDQRGDMTTILYYGKEAPILPDAVEAPRITFSLDRARASLWPAVDPVQSASPLLNSPAVSDDHRQIAAQARAWLDAHNPVKGHSHLSDFFAQLFFVAAPWTGVDGEYVPLSDTLEMVSGFLDGRYAERGERPFYPFDTKQVSSKL